MKTQQARHARGGHSKRGGDARHETLFEAYARAAVRSSAQPGTAVAFPRREKAEAQAREIPEKEKTMSTLRISVAVATSLVASFCASTSFAQEISQPTTTTPAQTQPAQPTQPAQQTQPVQSVTVQPPAQPQPVVVQPPVSTTTTTAMPYTPPGSERYTERRIAHRPNRPLLTTGASIFVLTYGASVISGIISDRDADKKLFIPVVGPWLDLGQRDCNVATPCGTNEDVAKAFIITSGVVQGVGVLMALGSFLIPETTTVEERSSTAKAKVEKPSVKVLPVSFGAGAGIGAVGRF
jgi:hypothetical protein